MALTSAALPEELRAGELLAEEMSQIEQGEYVARASGCLSCHGEDLSGGYEVETPMGTIVASNISPSREYGIGGYSRDDLADVLRRGVSPDRRLYPAMPYASYRGMTDEDIDALYVWLRDQEPVDEAPEEETDLPFTFNIRTGVIAWNWLFLNDRDLPVADDPVLRRGAYLRIVLPISSGTQDIPVIPRQTSAPSPATFTDRSAMRCLRPWIAPIWPNQSSFVCAIAPPATVSAGRVSRTPIPRR